MSNVDWLINDSQQNCYAVILRNEIPLETTKILYDDAVRDCSKQYPIRTPAGIMTLQPRFSCVYANDGITKQRYSGQSIPAIPWTQEMKKLRDYVSRDGFNPNSALLNGYLTSDHNVGWHSDKGLRDGRKIVATVSLGGSRRFMFREKSNHSNKVTTYLHNGDLVFFYGSTNDLYDHTITKPLVNDDKSQRYSVTFRVIDVE